MTSEYNGSIRLTVTGESHSDSISACLYGIKAGKKIDIDKIKSHMQKRAPGKNEFTSPRNENDDFVFTSGIKDGVTDGEVITVLIENTDVDKKPYENLRNTLRPSHCDLGVYSKYGKDGLASGSGHFSGRLTAPVTALGEVCRQLLSEKGIEIFGEYSQIGKALSEDGTKETLTDEMKKEILSAKEKGDSIGGRIRLTVNGVRAGIGLPIFGGIESKISAFMYSIPGVKSVSFGLGDGYASVSGSKANDGMYFENGDIKTYTNNCGGISGGITNGMPIVLSLTFKPTPSVALPQRTVDIVKKENTVIEVSGRHDPCIAVRGLFAAESYLALIMYDILNGEEEI